MRFSRVSAVYKQAGRKERDAAAAGITTMLFCYLMPFLGRILPSGVIVLVRVEMNAVKDKVFTGQIFDYG